MDRQRLHLDLRGAAAHRRRARRPLRAAAHVRDRDPHLRGRIRRGRACTVDRLADRGARLPGHRRRHHRPADAHDPVGLRPGRAPRRGARDLGRGRRPGRRARPGGRRRRRPGRVLAVDLLAERPDRPGAGAAGGPPPGRDLRPELGPRPAGRRAGVHGPARDRVRDHPRQPDRLGHDRGPRRAGRRHGAGRRVRALGAAHDARPCCRCASSPTGPSRPPTSPR